MPRRHQRRAMARAGIERSGRRCYLIGAWSRGTGGRGTAPFGEQAIGLRENARADQLKRKVGRWVTSSQM